MTAFKISLSFVALLFVHALFNAATMVSAVNQTYAACIGCWEDQGRKFKDPCANIRSQLVTIMNKRFSKVFAKWNVIPVSSSWMYEMPKRRLDAEKTPTGGRLRSTYSKNKGVNNSGGRDLAKATITCRSLCSTYPDCSAWCPKGSRRELLEEEDAASGTTAEDETPPEEGDLEMWEQQEEEDRNLLTDDLNTYYSISNDLMFEGWWGLGEAYTKYKNVTSTNCSTWLMTANCYSRVIRIS